MLFQAAERLVEKDLSGTDLSQLPEKNIGQLWMGEANSKTGVGRWWSDAS
jgi:hypothetical protein